MGSGTVYFYLMAFEPLGNFELCESRIYIQKAYLDLLWIKQAIGKGEKALHALGIEVKILSGACRRKDCNEKPGPEERGERP